MISCELLKKHFRLTCDGKLEKWHKKFSNVGQGWLPVDTDARDRDGYATLSIREDGESVFFRKSQVVYCLANGDIPDGMVVDHIDRVRDNDVPSNLRLVTYRENRINSSACDNNSNGVTARPSRKGILKFQAGIMVDRKRAHLGTWPSEEAAVYAYALAVELSDVLTWSSMYHLSKVVVETTARKFSLPVTIRRRNN